MIWDETPEIPLGHPLPVWTSDTMSPASVFLYEKLQTITLPLLDQTVNFAGYDTADQTTHELYFATKVQFEGAGCCPDPANCPLIPQSCLNVLSKITSTYDYVSGAMSFNQPKETDRAKIGAGYRYIHVVKRGDLLLATKAFEFEIKDPCLDQTNYDLTIDTLTSESVSDHLTVDKKSSTSINVLKKFDFSFKNAAVFDTTEVFDLLAQPYDRTKYPCGDWKVELVDVTDINNIPIDGTT